MEQMSASMHSMEKQIEVDRLGIVSINRLMMQDDWSTELTKTRQFIFGLVAFLKDKYPGLLSNVHQYIKDKNLESKVKVSPAFHYI
jgi:hypothetical protein